MHLLHKREPVQANLSLRCSIFASCPSKRNCLRVINASTSKTQSKQSPRVLLVSRLPCVCFWFVSMTGVKKWTAKSSKEKRERISVHF